MENIDIVQVLKVCSEYLIDPTDEDRDKQFIELKKQIVIRSYLPLELKEIVIEKALKNFKAPDDNAKIQLFSFTESIEMALTFDVLLSYTNIDQDLLDYAKLPEFYDLLWESGFCDYILQYCEKDFVRITNMIYHMLSYENLFILIDQFSNFDSRSMEELVHEFKKFKTETNPEALIALGDIALSNDAGLKTFRNSISENIVNEIMKKDESKNKVEAGSSDF